MADQEALKRDGVVPDEMAKEIRDGFRYFVEYLNTEIGEGSPEEQHVKDELGARVQREILPLVLLTKTAERCYSKPRGYAGDFMTIEWIYQEQPDGAGRLGRLLDQCFFDSPAAQAVQNRRGILVAAILDAIERSLPEPAQVTTMASGPAEEVFDVFDRLDDPTKLKCTLIDIDLQALAFLDDRIRKKGLNRQMNLVSGNLVYLATGRQKLDVGPQDLIYSIGLIDYFNDKYVIKLMNYAHALLRPGGKLILGNFHPRNTTRAFMDYVLDWKLIHRTEEDMDRLFAASDFNKPCTRVEFEQGGVNLFAECTRDAS
jgi:hypothetical protein